MLCNVLRALVFWDIFREIGNMGEFQISQLHWRVRFVSHGVHWSISAFHMDLHSAQLADDVISCDVRCFLAALKDKSYWILVTNCPELSRRIICGSTKILLVCFLFALLFLEIDIVQCSSVDIQSVVSQFSVNLFRNSVHVVC